MRPFLTPETLFFVCNWFACSLIFRSRGLNDPGTLWHVRIGELVLTEGIMRTDPLTFTFAGKTWIPQQWGGEILLALAHRIGGLDTLLLAFSLFVASLATILFRSFRKGGMGIMLAAVLSGFAIAAAGFHFYIRPHLATIGFCLIVMMILIRFDRDRSSWRWLLWLIPLHIIWTNLHGGMLGGMFSVFLMTNCWIGLYLMGQDSPVKNRKECLMLFGISASCALAMFVNPIGLELQRTWFRIVGSGAMARYVTEHSAWNFAREGDRAVLVFAVLYGTVMLSVPPRSWRVTWLLPILWFLATLKGIRHGPLFVVVAATCLADIWPHTRIFRWLSRSGDSLTRNPNDPLEPITWRAAVLPILIISMALVLQSLKISFPILGSNWAKLDSPMTMPIDLREPLQEYARSVPTDTPIFNDLNYGGFVAYFAPTLKIFADDRFELCGDDWLEYYVQTISLHPERFDDWQKNYGFTHALIPSHDPPTGLEEYLLKSGRWKPIAQGRTAVFLQLVEEK